MSDALWEFQETPKRWVRYDADVCKKLTDALASGSKTCSLQLDGWDLDFDFESWNQKNRDTKFARPIRAAVMNSDNEAVFWERQGPRRRWMPLPPAVSAQLESNHKYPAAEIDTDDGKASVSFEDMKMLFGVDFENESAIRRTLSTAEPSFKSKPIPKTQMRTRRSAKAMQETGEEDHLVAGDRAEISNKRSKLEAFLEGEPTVETNTADLASEVDPICPGRDSKRVYVDGDTVYSVMLNQTSMANNHNKFFAIQLLESTSGKKAYFVFFHWGRVGFTGQKNLIECRADLEKAKDTFCRKFFDKTYNEFPLASPFQHVKGKYDLLKMNASKKTTPSEPKKAVIEPSHLDTRVQELLTLICDVEKMEAVARGLSYDVQRAPLGNLTVGQISAGYAALRKIEDCITAGKFNKEFRDAVDDYYTRIPHYFGMRSPPAIKTLEDLKQELDLLEVLSDIEAAVRSENKPLSEPERLLHPLDQTYARLRCEIAPVDEDSERFELIRRYLANTHAQQHDVYSMELKHVFALQRAGEDERFVGGIGNRRLLWHGSRLTNWHGILSRGLRIAPKDAPVTGYMFGKGVYFADMSSKSANYCAAKPGDRGVLILAEVALGESVKKFKADSRAAKLPEGKHSVWGVGDIGPDPADTEIVDDGLVVPCGKPINQPETAELMDNDLIFNEYVVYNTNQVKLRYVVEVEFHEPKSVEGMEVDA